ncbi:7033_t:CDS:2, partial [Funneliformis geosporum]
YGLSQGTVSQLEDRLLVCPSLQSPVKHWGLLVAMCWTAWKSSQTTTKYFEQLEIERKLELIENEKSIELAEIERYPNSKSRRIDNESSSTITDGIVTFSQKQNDYSASSGNRTPEQYITPEDDEEGESSLYDTFPTHIHKRPESNPFIVNSQGTKHDRDVEEEDNDEYNADQTIIGGKSTIGLESLTQYQLEKNPPKTRPEYYDVIFFNDNNKDGFLETLDENIVEKMLDDVRRKEEKTEDTSGHEIKLLLDSIIDRNIEKTKKKLKLNEDIPSFEKNFALNFVRHMVKLIENVNLLLDQMSEGTYIVNVLAPILSEFFIKNKQDWYASYGETCLKASAKDEDDEEFSVTEVKWSTGEERLVTLQV